MPFSLPRSSARVRRVFGATALAMTLAAATITAQITVFNESFEGEIWELQQPALPALEGGYIIGVTFAGGNLYSADNYLGTILAYDPAGQILDLPDADWREGEAANEGSPVYGMVPSELATALVQINGEPPIEAVMVSDSASNRVFVFTGAGEHLFTMAVGHPGVVYPRPLLNGMAMTPGAMFSLVDNQPGAPTLSLAGSFAVAWPEYFDQDQSAAVVYKNQAFALNVSSVAFEAVPVAEVTGVEGGAGHMLAATGVAFDPAGNLYAIDSWTERVHAYDSSFQHLFTFGTDDPESPGATLEFNEPFGLTYWPSAAGDRLVIADMLNNRVVVYRPNLVDGRLDYLFALDGLGAISGFPHSVALDVSTGRIAVSDSFDFVQPKVWVFKTPTLAAFDLQVLDAAGEPGRSVCAGSVFQVRFSLTVPENRSSLQLVSPLLIIGGDTVSTIPAGPAFPVGTPADPFSPRDVVTYTYSLTAPASGAYAVEAGATASSISLNSEGEYDVIAQGDILAKLQDLSVSACPADNLPPVIVAMPAATGGWTKVEPPSPEPLDFAFTLTATDDRGIAAIEYRLFFGNEGGVVTVPFAGTNLSEQLVVPLTNPGLTKIEFSAQDNDLIWSPAESLEVRLDNSVPGICFAVPFGTGTVNHLDQRWWNTATVEVPIKLRDAHDLNPQLVAPIPPEFNVDRLVFSAERAGQVVTLVVRDHVGFEASIPSSSGLNPCSGPGGSIISIDRTGPAASADTSDAAPFQGPFTVTLSAHDVPSPLDGSSSGLRGIEYRIGAGPWERVPGPTLPLHFTTTTDLQFRGYDWAGNVGPTVTRHFVINRMPVVSAPADQISLEGNAISLPIAASDPDGDGLQYSATGLPPGLAIGASGIISGVLGFDTAGTYNVEVAVSDGAQTTLVTFAWRVDNVNQPPSAANDSATTVQGVSTTINVLGNDTDPDGTPLFVSAVGSASIGSVVLLPDGSVRYTAPATFLGQATFSYTVSDGELTATAGVTVTVVSANQPPVCNATATPGSIWPPNHKPVYVSLSGIMDPDDDPITVRFTSIFQDEPTDSAGQGNTKQDGGIEQNGASAWVRAERAGTKKVPGDGRVYLIGYTATDAGGASCTGTVYLGVPHDQGRGPAVLSPGRWNSVTGQYVPGSSD